MNKTCDNCDYRIAEVLYGKNNVFNNTCWTCKSMKKTHGIEYAYWKGNAFAQKQIKHIMRRSYNVLKPRLNEFYRWCREQNLPKKKIAEKLGYKTVRVIENRLRGKPIQTPDIAVAMAKKTGVAAVHFIFTAEKLKELGVTLDWVINGGKEK